MRNDLLTDEEREKVINEYNSAVDKAKEEAENKTK